MSDDKQLKHDVLAELASDPRVKEAHIGVTARDGVVTLTGHVGNILEKHAAEVAVGRVKGVRAVAEEIEIRLPLAAKRVDSDIADAVINRLFWDVSVPKNAIMVKVEKGWVSLTGEVEWHFQKEAAEHDVQSMIGVSGISNQITIKPHVDVLDIQDDIMDALSRKWFARRTFDVTAQGGNVKLVGTVASWHDRELAEMTAWDAPGTTAVENSLTVD